MRAEAKCVAHGNRRCTWCSLNPGDCAGTFPSCGTYAEDGMHWDTCPNRVRGQDKAAELGINLPPLGEGGWRYRIYTPRPGIFYIQDDAGTDLYLCRSEAEAKAKLAEYEHGPQPAFANPRDVTPREDVLNEAAKLITGDRNQTYGSPTQNFTDTANIWSIILRNKLKDGARIEPGEVASMMVGLKLARQPAQPKRDNWTDIAGYAGCGYECDVETGRISE